MGTGDAPRLDVEWLKPPITVVLERFYRKMPTTWHNRNQDQAIFIISPGKCISRSACYRNGIGPRVSGAVWVGEKSRLI